MVTLEKHISRQKMSVYLGGDSSTPLELAQEMISRIPQEVLEDPKSRFLDPCAGTGTFLVALFHELKKYHEEDHILPNMLYACEVDKFKSRILKNLGIENIYEESFLTKQFDMKFNIVIGNPPYQDGSRKDQANKLWPLFVKRATELLTEGGYFSFIHPNSWMNVETSDAGKGKSGFKLYREVMQKLDVTFLSVNSNRLKQYFHGVGSTFSYYTICNSSTGINTKLETTDGTTFELDLKKTPVIPLAPSRESFSIFDKVASKQGKTFDFIDQLQGYYTSLSKEEDSKHKWKLFHTPAKGGTYMYSDKPCSIQENYKVAISLSGTYAPRLETLGVTNMCITLATDDKNEADNILAILSSKLFKYYINNNKFSGFNPRATILKLPFLDTLVKWTDEEIYKYFYLTQEEINLIESTVG